MNSSAELSFLPQVDLFLGCISLLCHVIATPLNIISFFLFKKRKCTPTFLVYMLISLTDAWLSLGSFPYTLIMFTGTRNMLLLRNYTFLAVWTVLWEPSVAFAGFLVLTITVLRTVTIVVRKALLIKRRWVVTAIVVYAAFIWLEIIVMGFNGKFITDSDCIPYLIHKNRAVNLFQNVLSMVVLAFPVLPLILLTCVSSVTLVKSAQMPGISNRSATLKIDATVTVILFTVLFIILKIPLIVCYIRWIPFLFYNFDNDIFGGPSIYTQFYGWPVSYILLVQVNAMLSPFIYLSRMRWFRRCFRQLVTEARIPSVARTSNVD